MSARRTSQARMRPAARARRRLAALRHDRRGVALVEFALTVPVLVLLYCGGYQLMDAISTQRKVTTTVRTLADLTTQSTSLTYAQADQILAATTQVMAPYATGPASMRVTQVHILASGAGSVDWSRALNGTAYTAGSSIVVNSQLAVPNTYLIFSEMTYGYVPLFGSRYLGPITFSDRIYMSPRNSSSVALTAS